MEKVNFLTAGQSEEVALRFACDLVGKLYLKIVILFIKKTIEIQGMVQDGVDG